MVRVAYKNLGCKVNSYEIEKMRKEQPQSFVEVNVKKEADIYIINTCSVTHVADKKSRQMVNQAYKRNKDALIVVCGCFVDNININHKDDLFSDIKNIIYIDNANKNDLWNILLKNKFVKKLIKYNKNLLKEDKTSNIITCEYVNNDIENRIRAFIKIEEGCNNFCSYCIIPFLRGRIKSRPIDKILDDVKYMVSIGKKEIILTGIDINAFGIDYKNDIDLCGFDSYLILLIHKICDIDGVLRVRIGSLHPKIITENFVKYLKYDKIYNDNKNIKKFCPEFHVSLQSGSDFILQKMNRKYTTREYENAIKIIRKYFKDATITTDIIVGFPYENEKYFLETVDFAKKIKFYNPHIFSYSKREGTEAYNMPQVNDSDKNYREKELINITKKISDKIRQKYVGKTSEILVEEIKEDDKYFWAFGFNKQYIKLKVPYEKKKLDKKNVDNFVGDLIKIKVEEENFV